MSVPLGARMYEASEKDLYAVLGASSSDSAQELKHRYQQLVLQVNIALSACFSAWSSTQLQIYVKFYLYTPFGWQAKSIIQTNLKQWPHLTDVSSAKHHLSV